MVRREEAIDAAILIRFLMICLSLRYPVEVFWFRVPQDWPSQSFRLPGTESNSLNVSNFHLLRLLASLHM
jgi:hypothetical protein